MVDVYLKLFTTVLYMSRGESWHEPLQIIIALGNPQDFPSED